MDNRELVAAMADRQAMGRYTVQNVNGRPVFKMATGEVFKNHADLVQHLTQSQYRPPVDFVYGKPVPLNGPYGYWFEKQMRDKAVKQFGEGASVRREAYGITDASIGYFKSALEKGGMPVVDKTSAILRVFRGDGSQLSFDEMLSFMNLQLNTGLKDLGGQPIDLAKIAKRMKMFVTERAYASTGRGKPFRVGVFDPSLDPKIVAEFKKDWPHLTDKELKAMISSSYDGASVVSKPVMWEMHSNLIKDITQRREYLNARTTPLGEHAQLKRDISRLEAAANDLTRDIKSGRGTFNVRAAGLQYHDVNAAEGFAQEVGQGALDILNARGGSLKGNWVIGSMKRMKKAGADIITAVGSPNLEFMGDPYLTAERHAYKKLPYIDPQSLAAYPELFPEGELLTTMRAQVRGDIALIKKGELPPQFRAQLLDSLYEDLPFDDELALGSQLRKQAYARRLLDYVDSGRKLTDNPQLMKETLRSYQASWHKEKFGKSVPNFLMPDAGRASVITNKFLDRHVPQGFISYDPKTENWVMGESTWAKHIESFGGADLDDTLIGMLHYDREKKALKVLNLRQPLGRGEFGQFDIAPNDPFVLDMFRARGENVGHYKSLLKDLGSTSQATKNSALQQLEEYWSLLRDLKGRMPDRIRRDAAGKLVGLDPMFKIDEHLSEMKNLPVTEFSLETEIAKATRVARSQKLLQKYSNARLVADAWRSQNASAAIKKKINIVMQETAIDISTNALNVGGFEDLTSNVYRDLGENIGHLLKGGATDVGLEKALMAVRGGDAAIALLHQGMKASGYKGDAENLWLPEGHAKAYYSRISSHFAAEEEGIKGLSEEVVGQTSYPDYALNQANYPADAAEVSKTYRESIRRNVTEFAGFGDEELDRTLASMNDLPGAENRVSKTIGAESWDRVNQDTVESMLQHFEDGKFGARAEGVLLTLIDQAQKSGRGHHMLAMQGTGTSMMELHLRTLDAARERAGIEGVVDEGPLLEKTVRSSFRKRLFEDRNPLEMAEKINHPARWQRFGTEAMQDLLKPKSAKIGLGIIAALTAWGLVRTIRPKDHTLEDMQGPENLPGGRPYEGPRQNSGTMFGTTMMGGPQGGVTYEVRARGGFHPATFMQQVMGVTGGQPAGGSFFDVPSNGNPQDLMKDF